MTNLVTHLGLDDFNAENLGYLTNLVYVPEEGDFATLRIIIDILFKWATDKADEAWKQAKSKYIGCYITPDFINGKNYKTAIKEFEAFKENGKIYSYTKYEPWENWKNEDTKYTRPKYNFYNDEPYKGKIECNSIPGTASYIRPDTDPDTEE
jgi:hypothetical protein